jgi:poly-gamma-glutamate synthesis protein (capsule biosynthesis protein)
MPADSNKGSDLRVIIISLAAVFICLIVVYFLTYLQKNIRITFTDRGLVFLDRSHKQAKIMVGGDIMLDRKIRYFGNQNGYDSVFGNLHSLLSTADLAVANLEGPVTAYNSKTLLPDNITGQELTFTFDPASLTAVTNSGIKIVSLANNHTLNFGQDGLDETRKNLDKAGLKYFGDPNNDPASYVVMTVNDIPVCLVGYHEFATGFDGIIRNIRELDQTGCFILVMPHWGEEYSTAHDDLQSVLARKMIEAGADAIIGSHPHVVMDHEWIGKVPVYYSLGNLVFDQYFSSDVLTGNIVELDIERDGGINSVKQIRVFGTSMKARDVLEVTTEPIAVDTSPK